ncbi:MAG: hypothetical protein NTX91_05660 [candidate division SR1 bacterium]|nr:hypothetical protein [candidate division SR1 bacterium]
MQLPDKIYIVGGAGSGKSTLANKISEIKHIPHFCLDDITRFKKYTEKLPLDQRAYKLHHDILLHHKQWVIEGFAVDRVDECYQKADLVIVLDVHGIITSRRMIKRYFHRYSTRNFWGIVKLIQWALKYHSHSNPYSVHRLIHDCEKYKCNYVVIRDAKEILY